MVKIHTDKFVALKKNCFVSVAVTLNSDICFPQNRVAWKKFAAKNVCEAEVMLTYKLVYLYCNFTY